MLCSIPCCLFTMITMNCSNIRLLECFTTEFCCADYKGVLCNFTVDDILAKAMKLLK
jgi:hypothetical protein